MSQIELVGVFFSFELHMTFPSPPQNTLLLWHFGQKRLMRTLIFPTVCPASVSLLLSITPLPLSVFPKPPLCATSWFCVSYISSIPHIWLEFYIYTHTPPPPPPPPPPSSSPTAKLFPGKVTQWWSSHSTVIPNSTSLPQYIFFCVLGSDKPL